MYQTLYRKYRPKNFDEVVGQKVIVQTLKNAIKNNTLSHAYLFTGPRGTGKTSIAKILARTINCENLEDAMPCDKCVNCTQNNLDIIEIDAASNNGVDEIRELKNKINLVPSMGKYKIYIIDEVHMLSTGAFNALLKTLEEPPAHVIFVLATTDPHKVPATIISRCQRFDFKKIATTEMINRLQEVVKNENLEIEEEALKEIASLSDGGMRDALSLLDQAVAYADDKITVTDIHEINGTITFKEQIELLNMILDNNLSDVLVKINDYDIKGKDFIKLAEELILFFRNILVRNVAPDCFTEQDLDIPVIENNKLLDYIKIINDSINDMKISNNPKIIFELVVIKLINPKETNIEKLKKIRINNTLCNFNKNDLKKFLENIDTLNTYNGKQYPDELEQLKKCQIKALGNENIIVVNETKIISDRFNDNLENITTLFNDIFKGEYKLISVSQNEWEVIKKEFNNKERVYKYIPE